MKTIEIKLFSYQELSETAQAKARDWWRKCDEGDNYWSEYTIDEALEQAGYMGIEIGTMAHTKSTPAIFWSGFWSQGDGACFEGVWRASAVQADKVAEGWGDAPETTEIKRIATEFDRLAKKYPSSGFKVTHRGHYSHEYCTNFDTWIDPEDEMRESEDGDFEHDIMDVARDFMKWIYRQLEKEYEYHNSDKNIEEQLVNSDHLFEEDGTRTRHD